MAHVWMALWLCTYSKKYRGKLFDRITHYLPNSEMELLHSPSISAYSPKLHSSSSNIRRTGFSFGFPKNYFAEFGKKARPSVVAVNAAIDGGGESDTAVVVEKPPPYGLRRRFEVFSGHPTPFGATARDGGINFAVFSSNATSVALCLISLADLPEVILSEFSHIFL